MTKLREALADRLRDTLAHLRRELAEAGDLVLVEGTDDALTATAKAQRAMAEAGTWPTGIHPPAVVGIAGDLRVPLPLTVGEALDLVDAAPAELVDQTVAEIGRYAEALVPEGIRPEVLESPMLHRWPWAGELLAGPGTVLNLLIGACSNPPAGELVTATGAIYAGRAYPDDLDPNDAARWARERWQQRDDDGAASFGRHVLAEGWRINDLGLALLFGAACAHSPALRLATAWRKLRAIAPRGDLTPAHYAAADHALNAWAEGRDDREPDVPDDWRDRLARKIGELVGDLLETMDEPPPDDDLAGATEAGVPVVDALAARWLGSRFKTDGKGAKAAERLLARSRERLAEVQGVGDTLPGIVEGRGHLAGFWYAPEAAAPGGMRVLGIVAQLAWDELRPGWDLERERGPSALVQPLLADLGALMAPTARVEVAHNGDGLEVFGPDGRRVAEVDLPAVAAIDARAAKALYQQQLKQLQSLDAGRLFRYAIHTGHRQHAEGLPDFRLVTVEGGWQHVAETIGAPSKGKGPVRLRQTAYALGGSRFTLPGGDAGNLWGIYERRGARGRPGLVQFTLTPMALPQYARKLPSGEARILVPVLPDLPPLVGRPNDHGAIAALQLVVVAELAKRAPELSKYGGVLLKPSDWRRMAEAAGVPLKILPELLEAWQAGNDTAPAWLKLTELDRYTLADDLADVRSFLEYGGKNRLVGARAGRKSARGKRSRIVGKSKRRG